MLILPAGNSGPGGQRNAGHSGGGKGAAGQHPAAATEWPCWPRQLAARQLAIPGGRQLAVLSGRQLAVPGGRQLAITFGRQVAAPRGQPAPAPRWCGNGRDQGHGAMVAPLRAFCPDVDHFRVTAGQCGRKFLIYAARAGQSCHDDASVRYPATPPLDEPAGRRSALAFHGNTHPEHGLKPAACQGGRLLAVPGAAW